MDKKMYGEVFDPLVILKDRWNSFINRTHISEQEAEKVVKYIMQKHNLDAMDSLKRLINACIDKKVVLKPVGRAKFSSIAIINTITNLKEL